jgi:hypothetical protein
VSIKTKDNTEAAAYYDHAELESAILAYQKSLVDKDSSSQEKHFKNICEIYKPQEYIPKWYSHYKHLYDSPEDFEQDYMRVFCTTLSAWKPRHLRKPSRYGGKGHFQNFFWGALSHSYINGVKSEAAAKRNLQQQCPICGDWCNPLSTHLLNHHIDLLWNRLIEMGYVITELTNCPFCRSFKLPKQQSMSDEEYKDKITTALRKHMVSMHSSVLFETFHEKYPDHVTVSAKSVSVYIHDSNNEEEANAYDSFESKAGIDSLMSLNLTPLQIVIIGKILNDGMLNINHSQCDCTEDEFQEALSGLQDALVISGIHTDV